jgi:hypothetical protein
MINFQRATQKTCDYQHASFIVHCSSLIAFGVQR